MGRQKAGLGEFNEMVDLKKFTKEEFSAYYLGSKEVEGHGDVLLFKDDEGKNIDAWSSGKLKFLFKDVPKNCRIFIKYLGIQKDVPVEIPGKGNAKPKVVKKDVHDYSVEFDADDILK